MKDAGEAMDRVVAGLREVEAPAGMEGRVLAAVAERARAGGGAAWWWERTGVWRAGAMGSLLAGSVVVLWVCLVGLGAHRTAVHPASRAGGAAMEGVRLGGEAVAPAARRVAGQARRRTAVRVSRIGDDPLSGSLLREPSLLAPPLPLTEQERLLVVLVRQRQPKEVAVLDPGERRQQDEEAKVEFVEFFQQVLTKEKR